MSNDPSVTQTFQPESPSGQLDIACDAFETAWRTGYPPRIPDYLRQIEPAEAAASRRVLIELNSTGCDPRWMVTVSRWACAASTAVPA